MHFHIFLTPEADAPPATLLADVGLADLAPGANARVIPAGPTGEPGVLFSWLAGDEHRLRFAPDEQTWLPAVADGTWPAGRYHIGFWTESPPTPAELQRPRVYAGHTARFGDGHDWVVPRPELIPRDLVFADDGELVAVCTKRFADWDRLSAAWNDHFAEKDTFDFDHAVPFLADSLRINYRLTREVVNHLRLFTTENVASPLLAACGVPTLVEALSSEAGDGD